MEKLKLLSLLTLIMVLAFGNTFVACSSDDSTDKGEVEGIDYLRIPGTYYGQEAETIISHSSKAAAAYSMVTGDHYILRYYDGSKPLETISRGTIVWEDPKITFNPEDGSASFEGYYSENSFVITSPGWKPDKKVPSGGGGGGGSSIGSGQPTPAASYSLVANTSATNTVVSFTLTTTTRAVIPDGNYDYEAKMGDIIIDSGTATINNNVFAFLSSNGTDTFDYDATTGAANGSITLTPAKIQELEDAAGGITLSLPGTLGLSSFTEIERGSSTYWDGEWIRVDDNGTQLLQKLTFSGANYSYFDGYNTESGTFTYNDPFTAATPGTDSVFIFYRPGNQLAVYLFEGMADDPTPGNNMLELYNWMIDPLEIAVSPYWEPYTGWASEPNIPNFGDPDYPDYLIARGEWPRMFVKQ